MLFDCADCFREPTLSKYKESAVYDCLEIRSVERNMFHNWMLRLPQVIHGTSNDPWTVPITVSTQSTWMILSPHVKRSHYKDNVRHKLWKASSHYFVLSLELVFHQHWFDDLPSIPIFSPLHIKDSDRAEMQRDWSTGGIRHREPELLGRKGRWG